MIFDANEELKRNRKLIGKLFIGEVVDNNDPERNQRVRVRIRKLFGDIIPTNMLPWYVLKRPVGLGGSQETSSASVPEIGTLVSVSFYEDNIYNGIVDGYLTTARSALKSSITYSDPSPPNDLISKVSVSVQDDFDSSMVQNYPNSYGWIDSIKNWFKINKVSKSAEFVHSSGTKMRIDEQGNVTIHIVGNLKFIVEKDILESCTNKATGQSGQYFHRVSNNSDTVVGGQLTCNVAGTSTTNASMIYLN